MLAADAPRSVVIALALFLTAACASVEVAEDPGFTLRRGDTFAWAPPGYVPADAPLTDLQIGIGKALVERGLRAAPTTEADLLVDAEIGVAVVTAQVDPLYSQHVAERYELATFELVLHRRGPPGYDDVWRGTTQHRLRFTERAVGTAGGRHWQALDEERDWAVADVVAQLDASLPRAR